MPLPAASEWHATLQSSQQPSPTIIAGWPHLPCPALPCPQAQLLLVGDMGLYNSRAWPALAADAASGAYDALLHVGDLAYDLAGLQVGVTGLAVWAGSD